MHKYHSDVEEDHMETYADVIARYRSWPAAPMDDVCQHCCIRAMASEDRQRTGIPDLRLDSLSINVDGPRGKLDANGRLRVEVELVARESRENCTLTRSTCQFFPKCCPNLRLL